MDRYVIMVDAGYLMHKGVEIVSKKTSAARRDLVLTDPPALIQLLINQTNAALGLAGKELLRVYWYDGVMAGGHTREQRAICELPDVNFRAGLVNSKGQQKGVDSLIVTDLLELASNRAISDVALVTGDSDLAIGMELAQKKGVRIAVLGLEDLAAGVSSGQSREITDRADRVVRFGGAALAPIMRYVPRIAKVVSPIGTVAAGAPVATAVSAGIGVGASAGAPAAAVARAAATAAVPSTAPAGRKVLSNQEKSAIEAAVKAFIATQRPTAASIDASTKRIEASLDRALVHHVYTSLGHGALDQAEKIHARASFRAQLGC
jgi:uncharacterized LabA/DUF88 family protein